MTLQLQSLKYSLKYANISMIKQSFQLLFAAFCFFPLSFAVLLEEYFIIKFLMPVHVVDKFKFTHNAK